MDVSTKKVQALADHFAAFNQQLIQFVETCAPEDWHKVTTAEGWRVGVTAHHVGVVHYPVLAWVQLIVEGKPTPTITMADVDQMNLQHIRDHADCTPAAVIELLRQEGDKAVAYLKTINDADLNREAYLKIFDTTMSAGQLFQVVLVDEAEKHLVSMQETVQTNSSPMSPAAIK